MKKLYTLVECSRCKRGYRACDMRIVNGGKYVCRYCYVKEDMNA